jgi:hypothetical protein
LCFAAALVPDPHTHGKHKHVEGMRVANTIRGVKQPLDEAKHGRTLLPHMFWFELEYECEQVGDAKEPLPSSANHARVAIAANTLIRSLILHFLDQGSADGVIPARTGRFLPPLISQNLPLSF